MTGRCRIWRLPSASPCRQARDLQSAVTTIRTDRKSSIPWAMARREVSIDATFADGSRATQACASAVDGEFPLVAPFRAGDAAIVPQIGHSTDETGCLKSAWNNIRLLPRLVGLTTAQAICGEREDGRELCRVLGAYRRGHVGHVQSRRQATTRGFRRRNRDHLGRPKRPTDRNVSLRKWGGHAVFSPIARQVLITPRGMLLFCGTLPREKSYVSFPGTRIGFVRRLQP